MNEADKGSASPPTRSELPLLKVLWTAGEQSAREIHDESRPKTGWAYSTTRTTLERMVDKNMIDRRDFHGVALYEARLSRATGLAAIVRDFAERVLEIKPSSVVPLFALSDALSQAEIEEMSRLMLEKEEADPPST